MILTEPGVSYARASDERKILDIDLDCFGQPMTQPELRNLMRRRKDVTILVSRVPDTELAVGFIVIERQLSRLIVSRLVVSHRYRRMGHGSKLLWTAFGMVDLGCRVHLYLPPDNTPALEFCKRQKMSVIRHDNRSVVMSYQDQLEDTSCADHV